MKEIYWITRLDGLDVVFTTFLVLSAIVTVISIIIFLVNRYYYYDCKRADRKCCLDEYGHWMNFSRRCFLTALTILIVMTCGKIFVPTTKEAYMVYGVGGSIDYLRQDSIATRLPHKVLEALDEWTDSMHQEEKDRRK